MVCCLFLLIFYLRKILYLIKEFQLTEKDIEEMLPNGGQTYFLYWPVSIEKEQPFSTKKMAAFGWGTGCYSSHNSGTPLHFVAGKYPTL